jgi:riboflavin kinase / FMN adenylyltransferase
MQVHFGVEKLPQLNNAVITTGTFDGVHTGHKVVLQQVINKAKAVQGESVVITFYPHPRKVLQSHADSLLLINTLEERIALIELIGIDHLVVISFDESFYHLSATAYIKHFLVEKFNPHTIIIGYDHKFGNQREGDIHLLKSLSNSYGYYVEEISKQVCDDISVSSTKIRNAVKEANLLLAKNLLGYPFFFQGTIIKGKQLGRTIGYPTANLRLPADKLIPQNGVYAVQCNILHHEYANQTFVGMMNIGVRPTVDGQTKNIEVNIFDFNADIYDCTLRVYAYSFLREEVKFSGLPELKEQLHKDMQATKTFFENNIVN